MELWQSLLVLTSRSVRAGAAASAGDARARKDLVKLHRRATTLIGKEAGRDASRSRLYAEVWLSYARSQSEAEQAKVRSSEERSDELKSHLYMTSTCAADTSIRNVITLNSAIVSYVAYAHLLLFATRFARRRTRG